MSEEDLKKIEDYSYTMSAISSATGQDVGIGNLIYKLVQAYKDQQEDIKYYEASLDILDKREYRHKYLIERRKEDKSLAYPDADEIYKRYYGQKAKLENKDKIIDEMADCIAFGGSIYEGEPEKVKQYFERKVNSNE